MMITHVRWQGDHNDDHVDAARLQKDHSDDYCECGVLREQGSQAAIMQMLLLQVMGGLQCSLEYAA